MTIPLKPDLQAAFDMLVADLDALPPLCVAAALDGVFESSVRAARHLRDDVAMDAQFGLVRRARATEGIARGVDALCAFLVELVARADRIACEVGVPGESLLPELVQLNSEEGVPLPRQVVLDAGVSPTCTCGRVVFWTNGHDLDCPQRKER